MSWWWRSMIVGAILALVGFGAVLASVWLAAIAVVLAYVLGRSDESARRAASRGGYLHASGEHPYRG